MRRREVIALLALAASVGPLTSRAQTGIKRVGVVYHGGPYEPSIEGLRDGLKAAGLEEGRHVALSLRDAKGDGAEAEAAARVLERDDKVNVIVAITTTAALAAKLATVEVPIVFAAGEDPVAAGLVDNIANPGGRLTGFHFLTNDLTAKRLEILREIVPRLRRMATFYNARNRVAISSLAAAREAARKLGIEVVAQQVTSPEEIRDRVRTLAPADVGAFFFVADALVTAHAAQILDAAAKAIGLDIPPLLLMRADEVIE